MTREQMKFWRSVEQLIVSTVKDVKKKWLSKLNSDDLQGVAMHYGKDKAAINVLVGAMKAIKHTESEEERLSKLIEEYGDKKMWVYREYIGRYEPEYVEDGLTYKEAKAKYDANPESRDKRSVALEVCSRGEYI
jgi:hypothetical protein